MKLNFNSPIGNTIREFIFLSIAITVLMLLAEGEISPFGYFVAFVVALIDGIFMYKIIKGKHHVDGC